MLEKLLFHQRLKEQKPTFQSCKKSFRNPLQQADQQLHEMLSMNCQSCENKLDSLELEEQAVWSIFF